MTHRRSVNVLLWGTVITLLLALAPQGASANFLMDRQIWEKLTVGLSEICFLPLAGEPPWVEIMNIGPQPVDVAGWRLFASEGPLYTFPADLPPVPPNGIILVTLGQAGEDDRSFTDDSLVRLFSEAQSAAKSLTGSIGELALYRTSQAHARDLVQYVRWGAWELTTHTQNALEAGMCAPRGYVFTADPQPGDVPMVRGASIGRRLTRQRVTFHKPDPDQKRKVVTGKWLRYLSHEVSPGEKNPWPAPRAYSPYCGLERGEHTSFTWAWDIDRRGIDLDAWSYHVQVATDPEFEDLVIDVVVDGLYHHKPPLDHGQYYWRVRAEGNNEVTAWSLVTGFEIIP